MVHGNFNRGKINFQSSQFRSVSIKFLGCVQYEAPSGCQKTCEDMRSMFRPSSRDSHCFFFFEGISIQASLALPAKYLVLENLTNPFPQHIKHSPRNYMVYIVGNFHSPLGSIGIHWDDVGRIVRQIPLQVCVDGSSPSKIRRAPIYLGNAFHKAENGRTYPLVNIQRASKSY